VGFREHRLVPYETSVVELRRRRAEKAEPASELLDAEVGLPVADLAQTKECLEALLLLSRRGGEEDRQQGEQQLGTLPLSNVKRLFRSRFGLELSETVFGHVRVCDLLRDERFADLCSLSMSGSTCMVTERPQQLQGTRALDEQPIEEQGSEQGRSVDVEESRSWPQCPSITGCWEDAALSPTEIDDLLFPPTPSPLYAPWLPSDRNPSSIICSPSDAEQQDSIKLFAELGLVYSGTSQCHSAEQEFGIWTARASAGEGGIIVPLAGLETLEVEDAAPNVLESMEPLWQQGSLALHSAASSGSFSYATVEALPVSTCADSSQPGVEQNAHNDTRETIKLFESLGLAAATGDFASTECCSSDSDSGREHTPLGVEPLSLDGDVEWDDLAPSTPSPWPCFRASHW